MSVPIVEKMVVKTLVAVLMNYYAYLKVDYIEIVNDLRVMGENSYSPKKFDLDLKNRSSPQEKPSIEEPPLLELK